MVKTLITAAFAIVAALACIGVGGSEQPVSQAESARTARG
jgi:hypothetical protein